jgi:hypothetical protein
MSDKLKKYMDLLMGYSSFTALPVQTNSDGKLYLTPDGEKKYQHTKEAFEFLAWAQQYPEAAKALIQGRAAVVRLSIEDKFSTPMTLEYLEYACSDTMVDECKEWERPMTKMSPLSRARLDKPESRDGE